MLHGIFHQGSLPTRTFHYSYMSIYVHLKKEYMYFLPHCVVFLLKVNPIPSMGKSTVYVCNMYISLKDTARLHPLWIWTALAQKHIYMRNNSNGHSWQHREFIIETSGTDWYCATVIWSTIVSKPDVWMQVQLCSKPQAALYSGLVAIKTRTQIQSTLFCRHKQTTQWAI